MVRHKTATDSTRSDVARFFRYRSPKKGRRNYYGSLREHGALIIFRQPTPQGFVLLAARKHPSNCFPGCIGIQSMPTSGARLVPAALVHPVVVNIDSYPDPMVAVLAPNAKAVRRKLTIDGEVNVSFSKIPAFRQRLPISFCIG